MTLTVEDRQILTMLIAVVGSISLITCAAIVVFLFRRQGVDR